MSRVAALVRVILWPSEFAVRSAAESHDVGTMLPTLGTDSRANSNAVVSSTRPPSSSVQLAVTVKVAPTGTLGELAIGGEAIGAA